MASTQKVCFVITARFSVHARSDRSKQDLGTHTQPNRYPSIRPVSVVHTSTHNVTSCPSLCMPARPIASLLALNSESLKNCPGMLQPVSYRGRLSSWFGRFLCSSECCLGLLCGGQVHPRGCSPAYLHANVHVYVGNCSCLSVD